MGTGGGPAKARRAVTGINVTPLVDITLVLLIVFMVTAKLIVRSEALRVDLPRAATGEGVPRVFEVVVLPSGDAQIDGRAASDEDVRAHARAEAAKDHFVRAVLQADGAVPHRRVIHLVDLLQGAGISRIGFGVSHDSSGVVGSGGGER